MLIICFKLSILKYLLYKTCKICTWECSDYRVKTTSLDTVNNEIFWITKYDVWGSRRIAPTRKCTHFLKLDLWSPRAGFIPIISSKEINQIRKGNCKKKAKFYAYKWCNTFFKRRVQFRVGAIPRLPIFEYIFGVANQSVFKYLPT